MTKVVATLLAIIALLATSLDSKVANKSNFRRERRQAKIIHNPPIPTSIGHYLGSSPNPIDGCPRDEVLFTDGKCYQLLTQGPCTIDQYLILDANTNKPYCAERLCQVDRIFVFGDQLCHDPLTTDLCPPGRQLYETMYGTPICQCPDGTYEGDDDLDDDVCEPLLGQSLQCPPGQVFWFRDFSLPPECLPDPCGGDNLNRGPNDLPFVPFSDGKCFQLGSMPNVCPAETWYSIALGKLQGVCSTLEDAGYQVFDPETISRLTDIYGPFLPRTRSAPIPVSSASSGTISPTAPPSSSVGVTNNILTVSKGSETTLGVDKGTPSIDTAFVKPGSSVQGTHATGAGNQGFGQGIGSISQGSSGSGTFTPGFGTTSQGSSRPGSSGTSQGISQPGIGTSQASFRPGHSGINQGISQTGFVTTSQGSARPGTSSTSQGISQPAFGTTSHGSSRPGISGINQGISQTGFVTTSQGSSRPGSSATSQGPPQPGFGITSQGSSSPGISGINQGTLQPGLGTTSQGSSRPGLSGTSQGTFQPGFGTTIQGSSRPQLGSTSPGSSQTGFGTTIQGSSRPQLSGTSQGVSQTGVGTTSQVSSRPGFGGTSQGNFHTGFGTPGQASSKPGISGASQGISQTGFGTTSQGSTIPEISGTNQGVILPGLSTTSHGSSQPGSSSLSQRPFRQEFGTSQGATQQTGFGQGSLRPHLQTSQETFLVASGATSQGGSGTPTHFPGGSSRPGYSQRPVTPFHQGGTHSVSGSPPPTINQIHPVSVTVTDQSLESFGSHDDDALVFRSNHSPSQFNDFMGHSIADLDVQEARLLANFRVPAHSPSSTNHRSPRGDISALQAPPGHKLHGFFNSVRTLFNNGPHVRTRRSPLPHAAPGNVFETRLAGCRAGASRDINAKCRNTVLPPRTPSARTTPAPPVPPRRTCPAGQQFNIQRMCESVGNAINSINRFSLGK